METDRTRTDDSLDQPGNESAVQINEQVRELDKREMARKKWTPESLWAEWRGYVKAQEKKDPPEPVIVSGFCATIGLSFPDLQVFAQRGGHWARTAKRIELDCIERVERRLLRGQGNVVGHIFWLKNKASFRDRSPEESADEREDWLSKVQAAAAECKAREQGQTSIFPLPPEDRTQRTDIPEPMPDALDD